jgi:carboxypeptidase Taq
MMNEKFEALKVRLLEINDLQMATAVLNWDQSTYMPAGGAEARGRQMATLGRLAHEKATDPALGQLLEDLRDYEKNLPYDSDDASLIRVTRRGYEKNTKVPSKFMSSLYEHIAVTYDAWTRARPANDFKSVQALLEKTLDLSRELANFFPGYEHIADPLIDMSDEGMKASSIRELFSQLRAELVPLAQAITAQPAADDSCLKQPYTEAEIVGFCTEVIKKFGYDFNRGRLDPTHHPFMTKFSHGDVRITSRYPKNEIGDPLFSIFHETGHALYEQGINAAYEGTPLNGGTSSGVHESQSRLWENIVGRSREFWECHYSALQAAMPQFANVPLDTFYRAINKVERTLIRTEADEVTYNLHVMLRFDFELQLLEGKLAIKDLPEAWHERFKADFGVTAPDDRDGVLQDVHWYGGLIGGAFQGYTIGNVLSGLFYAKALEAHPEIPSEIGHGKFDTLHSWLTDNIYQYGAKYQPDELVQRVTDSPMRIEPYITYLRTKYSQIYSL